VNGGSRVRRVLRIGIERALVTLASRRWTLSLLNALYRRLGSSVHGWMQPRYAKLFRDGDHRLAEGRWVLPFAGRNVALPLKPHRAWLDWDAAFSLLGHEPVIKESYRALVQAPMAPDLFVDVGGNYGTHSLLFLVAGIEAITFEPNSACHEYFLEACSLNGVHARLEPVALGAAPGRMALCFPERETWLGSLDADVIALLGNRPGMRSQLVEVRTLDDYEPQFAGRRVLVKIDAEGHESAVLDGAKRTLGRHRPPVIFEVHGAERRARARERFARLGYEIATLPARA
jgi:FkbM family methyltransferase